MKSFLLILFCFVCVAKSYSQAGRIVMEITKAKHKTYTTKVAQLGLPGADSSWMQSFEKKFSRFVPVKNHVKKGTYTVSVRFILGKDGNCSDIECENNDPGFGLCAELVRELKKYGKWGTGKAISRQL